MKGSLFFIVFWTPNILRFTNTYMEDLDEIASLREKVDTLAEAVNNLRDLIKDNTRDTKSAKRNAKGWGALSVILSIIFKVFEILILDSIAL